MLVLYVSLQFNWKYSTSIDNKHSVDASDLYVSPFSTSQTYSVDKQVADSASTATAYHCGVKANAKTLGLNANAVAYECNTTFGNEVYSVLRRAKAQGNDLARY